MTKALRSHYKLAAAKVVGTENKRGWRGWRLLSDTEIAWVGQCQIAPCPICDDQWTEFHLKAVQGCIDCRGVVRKGNIGACNECGRDAQLFEMEDAAGKLYQVCQSCLSDGDDGGPTLPTIRNILNDGLMLEDKFLAEVAGGSAIQAYSRFLQLRGEPNFVDYIEQLRRVRDSGNADGIAKLIRELDASMKVFHAHPQDAFLLLLEGVRSEMYEAHQRALAAEGRQATLPGMATRTAT